MSIRYMRGALIFVLLATLTTSCANSGSTSPGPSDPAVEPSAGTPVVESTSLEVPPPNTKGPAIKVAQAPIGDGGTDEDDDGSRCVTVKWLGGQDDANLGAGIAFKITKVSIDDAEAGDFSCGGEPCQGFTFSSNSDDCQQAVRRGDVDATLSLYGRTLCSAAQQACADFRSRLTPGTISIPASERGGEETDGPTETANPTDTESEPVTPDEQPPPTE
jgi:hypothetical protein